MVEETTLPPDSVSVTEDPYPVPIEVETSKFAGAVITISAVSKDPLTVNCCKLGLVEGLPEQAVMVPVTSLTTIRGPAGTVNPHTTGKAKPTGMGGVTVLSVVQFARLLMAAIKIPAVPLLVVQLYLALIPELMAVVLALAPKAAGKMDEFEEKKQAARLASQLAFMLMPASSVGEA